MNPFRAFALTMMILSFFMYMTSIFTRCGDTCGIISLVCLAVSLTLICCVGYLESVHKVMMESVYLAKSLTPPVIVQITQPDNTPAIGVEV